MGEKSPDDRSAEGRAKGAESLHREGVKNSTPNRRRDQPAPPGGWETLSRRRVVDNRWLRLDAEAVRTPGGTVLDPWWLLEFPDWVLVVPVTTAGEAVLIRQWRQGAREFVLETPGGVIDATDASPEAAAARELLEETGFRAASLRHVGLLWPDAARNTNRCHIILALGCERVAEPDLDPGETLETILVPITEARAMLLHGRVESAMHCAALLRGLASAQLLEIRPCE